MKKTQNLIKNKGLINIFKKSKLKNYINKRKQNFFFNLFIGFKKNIKKSTVKYIYTNNKYKVNIFVNKIYKTNKIFNLIKISTFLLYIVYIKSYKPTTTTLRFKKCVFLLKFKKIFKIFKFFTKNNAGRNNMGIITIYSKGLKKKKNINITNPIAWDKFLYKIILFFRNKKKLLSVCKHTSGSLSVLPNISGVNINQFVFSTILPKKYWFNNLPGSYVLLKFLDKFCIFSNIFEKNFKKTAISPGTFCQIVDFFLDYNLVKVVLPSKKITFIRSSYFVLLGKNSHQQNKFCCIGKAGVNINNGFKPKVRGVARNPVDHPHGGRTKTNKPEVSIWGWVAKKNK